MPGASWLQGGVDRIGRVGGELWGERSRGSAVQWGRVTSCPRVNLAQGALPLPFTAGHWAVPWGQSFSQL